MTNKQKAKAYDKALEKIKDEERLNHMTSREIKDYLFPELAENNDERIRKEMLDFFCQFEDKTLRGVDISDWIDWFEKQNEVKSRGLNQYYMCIKGWHDSIVDFDEGKIYMGDGKYFCDNNNSVTLLGEVDRHFLLITKDNVAQRPVEWTKSEPFEIEHGKYYYCIHDYYSGGNKRASKGDVVQALRGMSMMALGDRAGEYFLPVNHIEQKTVELNI